ncbi:hypothetical protein ACTIVE_5544 [Actinomadura verrucosospora]|uniref:Uncharacterized protein n=1 Tax=Actinomadura verrucosospora TaxID=46165 RepID=A0A7D3ZMI9_ACTVE|nr:hypothetical protein ACTIVE_5544 [Actinomadura verrucosospora]
MSSIVCVASASLVSASEIRFSITAIPKVRSSGSLSSTFSNFASAVSSFPRIASRRSISSLACLTWGSISASRRSSSSSLSASRRSATISSRTRSRLSRTRSGWNADTPTASPIDTFMALRSETSSDPRYCSERSSMIARTSSSIGRAQTHSSSSASSLKNSRAAVSGSFTRSSPTFRS